MFLYLLFTQVVVDRDLLDASLVCKSIQFCMEFEFVVHVVVLVHRSNQVLVKLCLDLFVES